VHCKHSKNRRLFYSSTWGIQNEKIHTNYARMRGTSNTDRKFSNSNSKLQTLKM
ncbi:hypothetical protein P7K49_018656, partial [Saguinus oedipus]